jgi:DNA-binding LacI/PurR family transcriptional regulator
VVVPFFTHASSIERLRGIVAAIAESRYDLVLFNVESVVHRDEHFASLTRRDRADGLLVISLPPPPGVLARLAVAGIPVVLIDARAPGVPMVITDDVEGGRLATDYLVSLGHEDIAFIGDATDNPLGFTASDDREKGYRQVLARAGIELRPELVGHCPHDRVLARRVAQRLLSEKPPPTAVFASSDVQALGVLEAARGAGLSVPEDLSVVGFDDVEISAYAGLTTVRQPLAESGRVGARLLLDSLEGAKTSRRRAHRMKLELIERSTAGPRPRRRGARRTARMPAQHTAHERGAADG